MSKIIESFLTKNDCYKKHDKITVKGLVLHSVGVNQPRASVFVKNYNKPNFYTCMHGFIDALDGTVYKTLPYNINGWHIGGSANNTHLGFEMCEPAEITYTNGANFKVTNLQAAQKSCTIAYNSAVQLFAELCIEFKLDPLKDGVIISHSEAYKKGLGSNHADPEHLWKGLKMPYTMNGFRNDVSEKVKALKAPKKEETKKEETKSTLYRVQIGAFSVKRNAENYALKAKKAGFDTLIVNAKVNNLTIYRVQIGAFSSKKNAESYQAKAKKAGFDAVVIAV